MARRIRASAEVLRDFPLIGHQGVSPATREIVVVGLPYIIVYRIEPGEEDTVAILGIYHGAEDRAAKIQADE